MAFPVSGSDITSLNGNYCFAYLNQWYCIPRTPAVAKFTHFMRIVVGPPLDIAM